MESNLKAATDNLCVSRDESTSLRDELEHVRSSMEATSTQEREEKDRLLQQIKALQLEAGEKDMIRQELCAMESNLKAATDNLCVSRDESTSLRDELEQLQGAAEVSNNKISLLLKENQRLLAELDQREVCDSDSSVSNNSMSLSIVDVDLNSPLARNVRRDELEEEVYRLKAILEYKNKVIEINESRSQKRSEVLNACFSHLHNGQGISNDGPAACETDSYQVLNQKSLSGNMNNSFWRQVVLENLRLESSVTSQTVQLTSLGDKLISESEAVLDAEGIIETLMNELDIQRTLHRKVEDELFRLEDAFLRVTEFGGNYNFHESIHGNDEGSQSDSSYGHKKTDRLPSLLVTAADNMREKLQSATRSFIASTAEDAQLEKKHQKKMQEMEKSLRVS